MYSIKQTPEGWAVHHERFKRDVVLFDANGNHRFLGVPPPRIFDDFLGDVLADQWGSAVGSDGQVVAPAVAADVNGRFRMTTGDDAAADMATNGVQLHSFLSWKANQGNLVFETRVKLSAITGVALFVGLTDQIASLEMPIESAGSADTITTTATDAVGFFFDTRMTTDNWWLAGVKNNADATHQNSGIAPVADTYNTLRIELDASGNAIFYMDGVKIGTQMANAVTATVALTPVIAAFTPAAASRSIDGDYILVQADRA